MLARLGLSSAEDPTHRNRCMNALLQKLHLADLNPGACTGPDGWISDPNGKKLVSYNPATGEPIASIVQATGSTYDAVVSRAAEAFLSWRSVPAPRRGALVRDLG